MKFMTDFLLANTVLREPEKLELDLKMLFSKEAFNEVIEKNVTKKEEKELKQ